MLAAIHHKLRMIRYYSAPRRRTAWTVAADRALVMSLVLSVPAVVLCNQSIAWRGPLTSFGGPIVEHPDGSISARLVEEGGRSPAAPFGQVVGQFSLDIPSTRFGWPMITRLDTGSPVLKLDMEAAPLPVQGGALDPEDPIGLAITAALERAGEHDAVAAWKKGGLPPRWLAIGWIIGAAMWWVMLALISMTTIRLLGYLWRVSRGRRTTRRADLAASGKCRHCGYDLRGLELSERCPECGTLAV